TGATDKPPSQASVVAYVDDATGVISPTLLVPLDGDLSGRDTDGAIVATATGPLRWRDGAVPGTDAALIEPAGTNLNTNPWFHFNTNGYGAVNGTLTRETDWMYGGRASGKIVATANGECHVFRAVTVDNGVVYTMSWVVRNDAAGPRTAQL